LGCAALLLRSNIAVWKATARNRTETKLLTSACTVRLAFADVYTL